MRDHAGAAASLRHSLAIYQELADQGGECYVLHEIGVLYRVRGDLADAESRLRQSLDVAREIGTVWIEAHALAELGRCARDAGDRPGAIGLLRQALDIFTRIGTVHARELAAELTALDEPPAGTRTNDPRSGRPC